MPASHTPARHVAFFTHVPDTHESTPRGDLRYHRYCAMNPSLLTAMGLGDRFTVLRELGSGELGTVYEARDQERGERVALKVLHRMGADALYRFKSEFRALRDVVHPGLVHLGELIASANTWFFTMELIEGTSFQSVLDEAAYGFSRAQGKDAADALVRTSFGQLVEALAACHHSHRLHCDVKPANVRVDRAGRVVLLDFGLVLSAGPGGEWTKSASGGTLRYMAPEQASGLPVGPPADFYAMSVMLYEALTGVLPHDAAFSSHNTAELPLAPHVRAPYVPRDLSELCVRLLSHAPAERPTVDEIRHILNASHLPQRTVPVEARAKATDMKLFVGRGVELRQLDETLDEALQGGLSVAYVQGESGVGKTSLVEYFLEHVARKRPHALVLRGRCYERETVPYKAFDGIFDELAEHLRKLDKSACQRLLPRRASLMRQIFPVFGRVTAIAESAPASLPRDPSVLREQAFIAVRELLGRVAEASPLVMWIDDLQWTDVDSLVLLEGLLDALDPPPCLLIVTSRLDDEIPSAVRPFAERLLARERVKRIALSLLSPRDAQELARKMLDGQDDADAAGRVARESAGHPLFIAELVRSARRNGGQTHEPTVLEDALAQRIAELDDDARRVLDQVAMAGGPIADDVLASATQLSESAVQRRLSFLHNARLTRTVNAHTSDCFHDRVRSAVLGARTGGERAQLARRLAVAMETRGLGEDQIAELWNIAGEPTRAARLWPVAARKAVDNLAFDRAARLYERALEAASEFERDERLILEIARADALAGAGRLEQAADAYLTCAEHAPKEQSRALRTRAVQCFVQSGNAPRGLAIAEHLFKEVSLHLPTTRTAALMALLYNRGLVRLSGIPHTPSNTHRQAIAAQLDLLWAVAPPLVYVSIWQGSALTSKHLRLATQAGDREHLCRGLAQEATFLGAIEAWPQNRTEKLLAIAAKLSNESDSPYLRAIVGNARANARLGAAQFAQAAEEFDASERLLRERCTHVAWELTTARTGALAARVLSGDLQDHQRLVRMFMREARDRGDRHAMAMFRTVGMSWYGHILRDDVGAARAEIELDADEERPSINQAFRLLSNIVVAMYEEQSECYDALNQQAEQLRKAQLLRASLVDYSVSSMLGVAAAHKARALPIGQRGPWIRVVRKYAKRSFKVSPSLVLGMRAELLGHSYMLEGNHERAVELYNSAVEHHVRASSFRRHQVRYVLGACIKGSEGAALMDQALLWARGQGSLKPEQYLGSLSMMPV